MSGITSETVVDGRYRVVNKIGSGGMADVWCADDLQLGRKVAIKLLHRRFAEDHEFVERFRREASSAAGLQHPHVVSVYDRGEWDGTYYIAMEYLEGRSLKEIVQQEAPLHPERAIDLTVQILRAARFAHRRGIIHRDLKPHNVIVDAEGRAKVTDFGIARAGASDMTETGSIMGTAQYLSPEQAQGHAVSAESDIYAIGIILYELLTGRVPFDAESAVTIALKQVSEPPPPPTRLNPALPPELEGVVLRALEKEPGQRFPEADAFIAALERVRATLGQPGGAQTTAFAPVADGLAEHDAVVAAPLEQPRGRRRWLWALLAVLLLAGLAAGLILLLDADERAVPNVVGTDAGTASRVLRNDGFEPRVERVRNEAPADTVFAQDPRPGVQLEEGSTVRLSVSSGPGTTVVPDVEGDAARAARRELRRAGFEVERRSESSDDVADGRVIRTLPPAGSRVDRGSTVTLVVSSGPEQVQVPDVTGRPVAEARERLASAGLEADVTREESDSEPGTVLRQDPAGGARVAEGTTVTLVVAEEQQEVTVPDVTGRDQAEAAERLSAADLEVNVVERPVDRPSQDGQVLSQSPAGGRRVEPGSQVTITVGVFEPQLDPEGGGGSGSGGTPDGSAPPEGAVAPPPASGAQPRSATSPRATAAARRSRPAAGPWPAR